MVTARPISHSLAPALVLLGAVLVAANWYLRPERAVLWLGGALFLGGLALALALDRRRAAGDALGSGAVYGGLIVVVALGTALATGLGVPDDVDLSRRATMIMAGVFLVVTGNALPKKLTPLAELRCDPAAAQASHRLAGWTWVLTGLAVVVVWLVAPVELAKAVSLPLLVGGMLPVLFRLFRLRRTPRTKA